MFMVKKLFMVVTYRDELPPRNLHNPSMGWSCEVMSQIKFTIFPLAEDLWTPN